MNIEAEAAARGMTTEQMFEVAYAKERGYVYGLSPPKVLHSQWKKGCCSVPLYVTHYLSRPHVVEEVQLMLL